VARIKFDNIEFERIDFD